MEIAAVRCIAAGLADATYGVNAQLAALTLDGTDSRPSNVTVYNSADDAWVARQQAPRDLTFPALAVFMSESTVDGEVMTTVRDAKVDIGVAYLTKQSDSSAGFRDAAYTRRAIERCLRTFNANDHSAVRTRDNVTLRVCTQIRHVSIPTTTWGEDAVVLAATILSYDARDVAP